MKYLKIVGSIVLVVLVVFACFIAYGEINNRFYKVVVIQSGSMAPTFQAGDVIVIRPADVSDVKVGDIVVVNIKGSLEAHRLVEIKPDGSLQLKGDANDTVDSYLVKAKKLGVYVFKIPKLGFVLSGLGNKVRPANAFFIEQSTVKGSITMGTWEDPLATTTTETTTTEVQPTTPAEEPTTTSEVVTTTTESTTTTDGSTTSSEDTSTSTTTTTTTKAGDNPETTPVVTTTTVSSALP